MTLENGEITVISAVFDPETKFPRDWNMVHCEIAIADASLVQTKSQPMKKLLLALLLFSTFSAEAVTRTSIAAGAWTNPNIWFPVGVPTPADDTIIVATGVTFFGQNIYFGNDLFHITTTGTLNAFNTDTLTFGGQNMIVGGGLGQGYLGCGVLIVGASDSVFNSGQIEVQELMQSGTFFNQGAGRVCVAALLSTSDDFVNNGSVSAGNWVNGAAVTGLGGKFCIAGNFINTDQITGSIDICDATPGGLGDQNMGTISGSVTNCAVGPCVSCVMPGFAENYVEVGVSIVPHPINSTSLILLETELLLPNTESVFRITDVQGRTIKEVSFTGHQLSLDRTGIDSGLYFYSVILSDGNLVAGKLLVD
jgi:hypothetical protein